MEVQGVAGGWGWVDMNCALAREGREKASELRRRYAIVDEAMRARFPQVAFDQTHPVGRFHEVGDGMALCAFEIAAVTGLSERKVRARIRAGLTGRALILVDGRTALDPVSPAA